jgi:peroxiredoxin Q/BCP
LLEAVSIGRESKPSKPPGCGSRTWGTEAWPLTPGGRVETPGCTTQACGIRDHAADYDAADAVVLGISPDPVNHVKKFADKYDLGFTLLADEDHAVAEAYGVWVEKSRYGRTYWGNERTSFVIDPEGRVAEVLRKVKPAQHDDLVLAALGG